MRDGLLLVKDLLSVSVFVFVFVFANVELSLALFFLFPGREGATSPRSKRAAHPISAPS